MKIVTEDKERKKGKGERKQGKIERHAGRHADTGTGEERRAFTETRESVLLLIYKRR